jgi:hypothetical protein
MSDCSRKKAIVTIRHTNRPCVRNDASILFREQKKKAFIEADRGRLAFNNGAKNGMKNGS